MKFTLRSSLLAAAFFCAGRLAYGQVTGPTVEIPTTAHRSAIIEIPTTGEKAAGSDINVTMAGEYKSSKNVIEEQKPVCWNWYADFGYTSEYNFRGTNLTPDSDGALFATIDVSKWGFTLGLTGYHQLGTAHAPSFSIGEGGGGGTSSSGAFSAVGPFFPETVQSRFNELDVFLLYHREFGPIDVTVGNIAFFIDRRAETFINLPNIPPPFANDSGIYGPFPTVQNEQFDRAFIRLATSAIPYIVPWITYYQTLYSEGTDPFHHIAGRIPPSSILILYDAFERSPEENGGYLEGRLRGSFPIGKWIDVNPFGVISYSFGDRSEPVSNPSTFEEQVRGRPLRGFNVAQAGMELPIHVFHVLGNSSGPCAPADLHVDLVPGFTYSYHISDPTAGTDRNEVFGGVKLAVTF